MKTELITFFIVVVDMQINVTQLELLDRKHFLVLMKNTLPQYFLQGLNKQINHGKDPATVQSLRALKETGQ